MNSFKDISWRTGSFLREILLQRDWVTKVLDKDVYELLLDNKLQWNSKIKRALKQKTTHADFPIGSGALSSSPWSLINNQFQGASESVTHQICLFNACQLSSLIKSVCNLCFCRSLCSVNKVRVKRPGVSYFFLKLRQQTGI